MILKMNIIHKQYFFDQHKKDLKYRHSRAASCISQEYESCLILPGSNIPKFMGKVLANMSKVLTQGCSRLYWAVLLSGIDEVVLTLAGVNILSYATGMACGYRLYIDAKMSAMGLTFEGQSVHCSMRRLHF
jgi:hypothetical protein